MNRPSCSVELPPPSVDFLPLEVLTQIIEYAGEYQTDDEGSYRESVYKTRTLAITFPGWSEQRGMDGAMDCIPAMKVKGLRNLSLLCFDWAKSVWHWAAEEDDTENLARVDRQIFLDGTLKELKRLTLIGIKLVDEHKFSTPSPQLVPLELSELKIISTVGPSNLLQSLVSKSLTRLSLQFHVRLVDHPGRWLDFERSFHLVGPTLHSLHINITYEPPPPFLHAFSYLSNLRDLELGVLSLQLAEVLTSIPARLSTLTLLEDPQSRYDPIERAYALTEAASAASLSQLQTITFMYQEERSVRTVRGGNEMIALFEGRGVRLFFWVQKTE